MALGDGIRRSLSTVDPAERKLLRDAMLELHKRHYPKESPLHRQRQQPLVQMIADIPTACDRGTKCNAQGYKLSWNGYKLHIDTADCGVPVAALLSSASMHDSRAAIALSLISAARVTHLYDVMDAAYCSVEWREPCRSLGHVPLIDHNPRGGEKIEFEPAAWLSQPRNEPLGLSEKAHQ